MDTSLTFLILIGVLIVGFAGVVYFMNSQTKKLKDELTKDDAQNNVLMEWLKSMKVDVSSSIDKNSQVLETQLAQQRETLDNQMKNQREAINQQTKLIWERLDNTKEVIQGVQKQLGGIQEFGQDMKDLSNVLKSPKLRGGLGEQFLYDILGNSLPADMFKTQYKFKDGSICDTVVLTDKGIIPIDSKFPLENFKAMQTAENEDARSRAKKVFISDVKKRIDEIAGKYILPEQGTTSQAVMYIPSETVYYELIVNTPEIEEYSKNKNVVMASPNTLSYFLKVLLVGYQQHELEKNVSVILKSLAGLKVESEKFFEDLNILERHISNAYKSMDGVKNRYTKLHGRLDSMQVIEDGKEQVRMLE